ncbi:hypothetical protein [Parasphingorhabdus sp.]|uniref:hypothetical protein n=1 Tax=Parasphingorhabdus sp. TaxID=2709688 RepID=UPI00326728B1
MQTEPPLLIIAPMASDFDLAQLPWAEATGEKISANLSKFKEFEMVEVIVDAMPFLLSRHTPTEIDQRLKAEKCDLLFCDHPSSDESAIGIAVRDNLSSAKHLLEVNRRLLSLAKWIGARLDATSAAWMPSRRLASFSYFQESVSQYLADGPFPTLFQTSFSELDNGCFVTNGLHYFAEQEIHLTAPLSYSISDVTERLVRIIDDIANHGRIEVPSRSKGMIEGETLIFLPSHDLKQVDIEIRSAVTTN